MKNLGRAAVLAECKRRWGGIGVVECAYEPLAGVEGYTVGYVRYPGGRPTHVVMGRGGSFAAALADAVRGEAGMSRIDLARRGVLAAERAVRDAEDARRRMVCSMRLATPATFAKVKWRIAAAAEQMGRASREMREATESATA